MQVVRFVLVAPLLVGLSATNDCSHLDGEIDFHGFNMNTLLKGICEVWPGDFPVETVGEAEELINATFKAGGIYEKAKEAADDQMHSGDFCYTPTVSRVSADATGHSCPKRFNKMFLPEWPKKVEPFQGEDGHQYCEKTCREICGFYLDRGEVSKGLCGCRSLTPQTVIPGQPMFIYKEEPRVVFATPEGCEFAHGSDCFGNCPENTKPTWVSGEFRPVCSKPCGGNFSLNCGFGCASSTRACVTSITDQVGEVARVVGTAVGFFTGQVEIAVATDAIVNLVEFSVGALSGLVVKAITAWKNIQQQKQAVGLVAAIMQVVEELKENFPAGKKAWGEAVKLLAELTKALKGWHGWHMHSTVKQIAEIFLKHGATVIVDVFKVLGAFVRSTCPEIESMDSIVV